MNLNELFITEDKTHIAFCYGRFQPPHFGHKLLMETTAEAADGGDFEIYTSASQDPKKNPLDYKTKIGFIKAMFPEMAQNVPDAPQLNTVMKVAADLYRRGYRSATFVAGKDQIDNFRELLTKYNGQEAAHGFYQFSPLQFIASNSPDVRATQVREAAAAGDIEAFAEMTGAGKLTQQLFDAVRKGMNIKDQGVAEGSEFGAYYSEQVAQQIFNKRQDITSEDEVLNQAYHIVSNDLGQKAARYKFNYDEDFPSDVVSNYFHLQKQGVAEMDKSGPQPGRDGHVSHSTYGSRDKGTVSNGLDRYGKVAKPKDVIKKGAKALDKAFRNTKESRDMCSVCGQTPCNCTHLDEARMSNAVKLQRAWEREQAKSTASRRRGEEVMAQAKADAEKKSKEQGVAEDWQKVNKSDKTDGMSSKAVKAYRRENPGSKLKTAVTKKPSKLKKGSKASKRRSSFCARMSGMKKAHASAKTKRDPDSPINKALRRWNCESIEEMNNLIAHAELVINQEKQQLEEHKKGVRAVKYTAKAKGIDAPKPRNPVAKNATAGIGGGAAGAHKDKKKASKQGQHKHKHKQVEIGESWEFEMTKIIKLLENKR